MSKHTYPITPAVRVLRENGIEFEPFTYAYEEHGGTAQFARLFGKDEHLVIKTIVLQDENGKGLIVLMHGDKQISTRGIWVRNTSNPPRPHRQTSGRAIWSVAQRRSASGQNWIFMSNSR